MSENSGENETYNDYSVDDEDQPQGDGDSLVATAVSTEPLDEGYSPPEKWSAAEGFGNTPVRGGARRDARPAARAGGARAGPLRRGGRPRREDVGGEVGDRARRPAGRRGRGPRPGRGDGPGRRGRRHRRRRRERRGGRRPRHRGLSPPDAPGQRAARPPVGAAPPARRVRTVRSSWWTPRSPESVSRASSAACASSSARRVASSRSWVAS